MVGEDQDEGRIFEICWVQVDVRKIFNMNS